MTDETLADLFTNHGGVVMAAVKAVLGPTRRHQWEDVAGEVWLDIVYEAPKFKGKSKIETWAHSIARRSAIDWLRKQTVRERTIV